MSPSVRLPASVAIAVALLVAAGPAPLAAQDYETRSTGTRTFVSPRSGLEIRMLVEASNLGSGDVEIGEITFPAGSVPTSGHRHGAIEIFYVLSGTLVHVVNGDAVELSPGMVGIVRPEDEVIHQVPGEEPVRALVIWAPGGEAERLAPFFEVREPIGGASGAPADPETPVGR